MDERLGVIRSAGNNPPGRYVPHDTIHKLIEPNDCRRVFWRKRPNRREMRAIDAAIVLWHRHSERDHFFRLLNVKRRRR